MPKRPHSHPAHRNVIEQDKSDVPPLLDALRDCVKELEVFKNEAYCDHDINLCWCPYFRALEKAKKLIECHERSDKFIAELDVR